MRRTQSRRIKLLIITTLIIAVIIGGGAALYYISGANIVIDGDKNITLGLHGVYEEKGVKSRFTGRDLSSEVMITGNVDVSKPGVYTIKYKSAHFSAKRTVTVLDKMNPGLTLKGENEIWLKLGEAFEEPGYKAYDSNGKDISGSVKVSDTDFEAAGRYEIEYLAEDSSGRKTMLTRTVTVEPNTEYETSGLPICMYHYVFDENDPPDDVNSRFGNYISQQSLEEELQWLKKENYYFPTWAEVGKYVAGEMMLPDKSIVLCFDDGSRSFLENGIPVLEKYEVPATCFMITSNNGSSKISEFNSKYVTYQSHSHDMHRAGGYIGHGGIFTAMPDGEALDDLRESIRICGSGEAFAYPYGDYDERCRDIVERAGFICAVTTQYGKVYPGYDAMLLPRVRMVQGQTLESFIEQVSPETDDSIY